MKNYKALSGYVILRVPEIEKVEDKRGILVVNDLDTGKTVVAEIISVGDERDDLKVGMKTLFQTNIGLSLDKEHYLLKYCDITALIDE